jgi:hypothetical protein
MPALSHPRLLFPPAIGAVVLLLLIAHSTAAQSATGTITGRVMWGPCVRGIPLPMAPDAPNTPDAQPQPAPGSRPTPINGLPAGAVLVAVQNTAISARTDEAGRFSLAGVPAGQYLTVAAGPVANEVSAVAERPNVFVNGGDSVEVGTLSLGGPTPLGIACRMLPGLRPPAAPDADQSDVDTTSPNP